MAKEALMEPIDMHELLARGPRDQAEELRIELYEKVNALGIGAQGLGGLTTVLDVKIQHYPDARRVEAGGDDSELRGDAARALRARRQRSRRARAAVARRMAEDRPGRAGGSAPRESRHAHARGSASWKPGETLLLNGKMLTGRDAAHKRIADLFASGRGPAAGRRFHATASSTTSARSIRCATKSSGPRVRRPRRAWTSSPT